MSLQLTQITLQSIRSMLSNTLIELLVKMLRNVNKAAFLATEQIHHNSRIVRTRLDLQLLQTTS
jgi:hypothetical protein